MKMTFTSQFERVRKKFVLSLPSLNGAVDNLNVDPSGEGYFSAASDYDPITAEYFLDTLCLELSTDKVWVFYLNIDLATVVLANSFVPSGPLCDIERFRIDHVGLHGGNVEGSYFAIDQSHEWAGFYDALEDFFLLHLRNKKKLEIISDFVLCDNSTTK